MLPLPLRRRHGKLNQAASLRASAKAAGHGGYAAAHGGGMHGNPSGVYQSEAEKLALERRLLTENRRVLELEEELDRQLTREQRMKRQLEKLRSDDELRHHRPGTGVPVNYGNAPQYAYGPGDERSYDQGVAMANLRSALAVQQAEIEDLQRVKREMREQIGLEREMRGLEGLESQEMRMLQGNGTPYYPPYAVEPQRLSTPQQQQALYNMQAENQRMVNELQRIRQYSGYPAAGAPVQPQYGAPAAPHIALQQMEAQLTAQLQWIRQQQGAVHTGIAPWPQGPAVAGGATQPPLGYPHPAPVGPMRQADFGGADGNMRVTFTPGGTVPARYAPAQSGVSAIDPATGTRNWRVQGGLTSAAMAQEGKAKQAKPSRKVAWVEQPSAKEVGQEYQVCCLCISSPFRQCTDLIFLASGGAAAAEPSGVGG